MKEIMRQYGQSMIAVLVAVLLFGIIGGGTAGSSKFIYSQAGQGLCQENTGNVSGNAEFERYWRIR